MATTIQAAADAHLRRAASVTFLLRVAFPLPPFALWPVFPTSDYYGGSDAVQASSADCWPLPGQPPTFTLVDSAKEVRRRLSRQPIRSLRFPTGREVGQVARSDRWLAQAKYANPLTRGNLGYLMARSLSRKGPRPLSLTRPRVPRHSRQSGFGWGRYFQPMQVITRQGSVFPKVETRFVGTRPAPSSSSPACWRHCLAPHRYLSGPAVSPPVCIHRQLRPNDAPATCIASGATDSCPFAHSTNALRGAPR
jgi:hypothetical protein